MKRLATLATLQREELVAAKIDVFYGEAETSRFFDIKSPFIDTNNGVLFFKDKEGNEHHLASSTQWHIVQQKEKS